MNICIVAVSFALAVPAALLCLVGRARHSEEKIRQLSAFAETLLEEERAVFWRFHQNRDLWNSSRYPKAFHKWKKRQVRAVVAPTQVKA